MSAAPIRGPDALAAERQQQIDAADGGPECTFRPPAPRNPPRAPQPRVMLPMLGFSAPAPFDDFGGFARSGRLSGGNIQTRTDLAFHHRITMIGIAIDDEPRTAGALGSQNVHRSSKLPASRAWPNWHSGCEVRTVAAVEPRCGPLPNELRRTARAGDAQPRNNTDCQAARRGVSRFEMVTISNTHWSLIKSSAVVGHVISLNIAIVVGSTRPGRNGKAVGDWVLANAAQRQGASYGLVDLADFPLPMYDEPNSPVLQQYTHEHTRQWSAEISKYDGFIFVTPEYNHSTSAVLKNALDFLYKEWNDKAAAFVSWGGLGGARAIEHLRTIASELKMAHVRQQVSFSFSTDFDDEGHFAPTARHGKEATALFDELEAWARALKPLRS